MNPKSEYIFSTVRHTSGNKSGEVCSKINCETQRLDLMMTAHSKKKTILVLTRPTWHHIPEDFILQKLFC
jgi:hypothetical protein